MPLPIAGAGRRCQPAPVHPPITIVGYGSLMSAYGLARNGAIRASRVRRVQIHNARRGFGKASIHGARFAMVLEPMDRAARLRASTAESPAARGVAQALAIDVAAEFFPSLAQREGYSPTAARKLLALALDSAVDLATYLAEIAEESNGDIADYRGRLRDRLDYTSAHYIPHPIDIDGSLAIVFLAPGNEGSGSDGVVPVRVRTGVCELMTTREVWLRQPNDDQLDYIAMCLLAGAHGICVDDLLGDLPTDLVDELRRYEARFSQEAASLQSLLHLSQATYREFRGPPRTWLAE